MEIGTLATAPSYSRAVVVSLGQQAVRRGGRAGPYLFEGNGHDVKQAGVV